MARIAICHVIARLSAAPRRAHVKIRFPATANRGVGMPPATAPASVNLAGAKTNNMYAIRKVSVIVGGSFQ